MPRHRIATWAVLAGSFVPASAFAQSVAPDATAGSNSDAPVLPPQSGPVEAAAASGPATSTAAATAEHLGPDAVSTRSNSDGALLYEKGGMFGIGLVPTAKVGGSFNGTFTALGTSPDLEIELGYTLPVLDRSLEPFLGFVYTQPKTSRQDVADSSGLDGTSRLDAAMHYDLTQQEFIMTAGLLYRLRVPVPMFRPYAALGARLYLMKTRVDGSDGTDVFGQNREGSTRPGAYGALGGELHFGPGALLLEAQLGYAKIDGFVMRNTNTGALNLALGYRFFL
jgi:hypothetical protein